MAVIWGTGYRNGIAYVDVTDMRKPNPDTGAWFVVNRVSAAPEHGAGSVTLTGRKTEKYGQPGRQVVRVVANLTDVPELVRDKLAWLGYTA